MASTSTSLAGTSTPLQERPAWRALQAHYEAIKDVELRKLFADDPKRGERLTAEGAGLFLDYSENRVVLHIALRAPRDATIEVDGQNVVPEVHAVLDKMSTFAHQIRSGAWK